LADNAKNSRIELDLNPRPFVCIYQLRYRSE